MARPEKQVGLLAAGRSGSSAGPVAHACRRPSRKLLDAMATLLEVEQIDLHKAHPIKAEEEQPCSAGDATLAIVQKLAAVQ